MEHAVRQYKALAKYRSESVVRNAPTLALARGTPKKINSLFRNIQQILPTYLVENERLTLLTHLLLRKNTLTVC
ncbi:MAG: hypothetical protein NZ519_06725 [Bacteroidia bacterium]|nr:hypothetical protein [Bacteroidia bacterium]